MKEPTQKQLIERWENVLRVLQGLSAHQRRKHWDMSNIAYATPCGTICCAVGYCGLDPWFRRRGLKTEIEPLPPEVGDDEIDGYGLGMVQARHSSSDVDTFFGDEGTYTIFWNATRRPVGQVIREVRMHIKRLRAAGSAAGSP